MRVTRALALVTLVLAPASAYAPTAGSPVPRSARAELARAGLTDVVIGTRKDLGPESFSIGSETAGGRRVTTIAGGGDRGVLYGTFALLRRVALRESIAGPNIVEAPAVAYRWTNE